ncbi:MAG TPA: hypothetical protein VG405_03020 [Solirubrobacteraceae bacterium]|jgi:hypothetical protein|nr:hypothetical protein [Solirubrobacteraceae bacterium]
MSSTARQLTVVCAHAEGTLPTSWFRTYKQLKRKVKRSGLNARVSLAPTTALPERIDVLVLPPTLSGTGDYVERAVTCLTGPADQLQRDLDALVDRLREEGRVEYAEPDARTFATHVGFRATGERARLDD